MPIFKSGACCKVDRCRAGATSGRKHALFFGETGPMGMDLIEVKALLDVNEESLVRLQKLRWWARIDGTKFGTSVLPSDLQTRGTFRLYGPPPKSIRHKLVSFQVCF